MDNYVNQRNAASLLGRLSIASLEQKRNADGSGYHGKGRTAEKAGAVHRETKDCRGAWGKGKEKPDPT